MAELIVENNTLITSKTDLTGKIIYANEDFCKYAQFSMQEILYKPHNIIRHPDMPRCVFKLIWDTIKSGKEVFGYIKNKTKQNNFYWVFANITPTFDENSQVIDYYSVRRFPRREVLSLISSLYASLREVEASSLQAGCDALTAFVKKQNMEYNEMIYRLQTDESFHEKIRSNL